MSVKKIEAMLNRSHQQSAISAPTKSQFDSEIFMFLSIWIAKVVNNNYMRKPSYSNQNYLQLLIYVDLTKAYTYKLFCMW